MQGPPALVIRTCPTLTTTHPTKIAVSLLREGTYPIPFTAALRLVLRIVLCGMDGFNSSTLASLLGLQHTSLYYLILEGDRLGKLILSSYIVKNDKRKIKTKNSSFLMVNNG